ncbi:hypothetical protein yc1106_00702 [Curvularia clavata]|uniref:F-box domain-containing protein n=1 Tax=Curvularia clavata TaxID=95742 RepID=A0A9Q8Z3S4_CURCL|nr:hypothetical protein yc1106_00702 [Curvularia clavata]
MDRLQHRHYHHATPVSERARNRASTATPTAATGDKVIAKKRSSLGKAAGGFQSRLLASLRSRRRSENDDHRLAAPANHCPSHSSSSSPFLDALFRLPDELHIYMLRELCVADLLALRRTSRVLNMLVTENAPALVRYWVKHRMGNLHLQLYPAPRPSAIDFPFLLTMRRRHIASLRLTRQLADHLVGEPVEPAACPRQKQLWSSVFERMLPLVFGVGYFLDEHRRLLLERDLGRIRPRSRIGYHVRTTAGIADQERKIVRNLDAPLRLQYFYTYCFIVQVLLRTPACSEDVAFLLILGGIGRVAKLLACPTYSERRRYLAMFRKHMSPHTSKCWRRHWKDAGVVSPALLDDIPCTQIGVTQLDQIWAPLIAQMMEPGSRDFTEQERRRYEELKVSGKFINEVMGYDILQGRAADGGESAADDDDDDEP